MIQKMYEKHIEEYIEMLNNGYEPKSIDKKTKFIDGTLVKFFWQTNRQKIKTQLETDPKYTVGYEVAKEKVNNLLSKLTLSKRIEEYIEMLNSGYEPKYNDQKNKFSDGILVKYFWQTNRQKIKLKLETDPKYIVGYEVAKNKVNNLLSKLTSSEHIEEYIEVLNNGYEPKAIDKKTKFSDGIFVNQFWQTNRQKIKTQLETDPKYIVGYEVAKEKVNNLLSKLTLSQRIEEYIEMLNKGYDPKYKDEKNKFSDGTFVGQFWTRNKEKIKSKLETDPKYGVGYEVAKEKANKLAPTEKFENHMEEYIEMLNSGYEPKAIDKETRFSDGTFVKYFWSHNKEKIIQLLFGNSKYSFEEYNLARKMVLLNTKKSQSVSETLLKYKTKEELDKLLESALVNETIVEANENVVNNTAFSDNDIELGRKKSIRKKK